MPSKLLITAAKFAHDARHAPVFGVRVPQVEIDGPAVLSRVRQERDHFLAFVLKEVHDIPAHERLRGFARFVSDRVLRVEGCEGGDVEVHAARGVVIATGSRTEVPDLFKGLGDRVCISDDVFEWTRFPKRVAVIGTGPVGLELGQALHRLDVRVRVLGKGETIGGLHDPAIQRYAAEALGREYPLHTDVELLGAEREGDGVRIRWREDGEARDDHVDMVLVAAGRPPAVDGLDLGRTSAPLDEHGTPVVDRHTMQAGHSPIFVAGDANHQAPLLHEAHAEGLIAGTNAARFPDIQAGERTVPFSIVFSDPQLVQVGPRADRLDPDRVVTGRVDFEEQGRSRIMDCRTGLLHLYADRRSGALVGAEGMGPELEHIGHLLAWAVQCGLTVEDALKQPYYHPTLEEGLRTALRDARSRLG